MADEAREERWLDAKTWAIPTGLTLIIAVVLYGMIGLNHDETAVIGGVNVPAKAVGTVLFTKYIMLVEVAAFLLLAALVAAYHLGKESNDDEIVDNDSLAYRPSVGSIKEYDEDKLESNTDATKMAKPYVYDTVDPNDYVAAPRSKRKELD
jgi:NADH-quinone oxidoreductase subunit J